ncbi:predicted protein [Nematostella vectensis]|uniref:Major facilitator superfamily (MFS) profile domain-containing protein n=2 Tax=Nematostella vectensis TaxID=45351 RepID=A7S5K5_NEMVE|nr:predicted protein [Nematostella vectensis]|eukprot:XP_001633089.1 predicted protein [Nematostella vectensis]
MERMVPTCYKCQPTGVIDGGYAWVVCFAAFVILLITVGQQNCSGIIFVALMDEYKQGRGATAWVTSLAVSLNLTFGPLSAFLCQRFGCRVTAMLGGGICAVSLFLSAFAVDLYLLYFTYGVLLGLGNSLCYTSALIALTLYFRRHIALANSLGFLGPALGIVILTPLLKHLFQTLSLRYVFFALSVIQIIIVAVGSAFRPFAQTQRNKCLPRLLDSSPFRDKSYRIWVVALCFFMPAILVPYVHIVKFAEDHNIEKTKSSTVVVFFAIGSITFRPILGRLSDYLPSYRLQIFQLCFLVIALANTFVVLATNYIAFAIYAFIFGSVDGIFWSQMSVITQEIVGMEHLPAAFGWLIMIISFPGVLGPPLAGWLFSVSQTYTTPFMVSGALVIVSICLMFAIQMPVQSASRSTLSHNRLEFLQNGTVGEKLANSSRDSRVIVLEAARDLSISV